jgi:hypothetical protein
VKLTQYSGLSVFSIREYKDQFYLLCYTGGLTVRVHSKDGNLITSWEHEDTNLKFNQLGVHQDVIYIPSRSQNKITSYTLTGAAAGKDISISLSNTEYTSSVCVTPSGHLVYRQRSPSLVVCFELKTRSKLWSLNDLNHPLGITCDKKSGHLLIYTGG